MTMRSRYSGLVLVALMVGSLVLASCTAGTSPSTSNTDTKPYGSLVLGVNLESGALISPTDPYVAAGGSFQAMGAAIFDSLIHLTTEGQPIPGIAERWEISSDGKAHTFYIRKGVKFHDGSDLTGADVKFSIESFVKLATGTYVGPWKAVIDSVELKDDYTVVLRMKEPQFQLLNGQETLQGESAILPKKYIEEKGWEYFDKNPIGSGPWKFVSLEPNSRLVLEAVESHWRAVPKFQKVTLVRVPEEGTKVAMLKTGELDVAEVSPDSVAGLKSAGLKILGHYGSAQWYTVPFWDLTQPEKYALGDVRVRKALSLAIDRKEMADKLYSGYAQPSALFYTPKTAYYFDPNVLKPDPLDVDQAKRLLSEAGYANGFTTRIWDAQGGAGVASTGNVALAGYWRKIGVNAEMTPIDYPSMLKKFIPKHTPEIWNGLFAWASSGGNLQFEKMVTAYHPTKGVFGNVSNARLGELIDKVPQTANQDEKKKMALEAATLAKNGYTIIPLLDVDSVFAYGSTIGELKAIKGLRGLGAVLELITHSK